MTITLPHKLGGELGECEVGDEICVKLDGTVQSNKNGELVLDVDRVRVKDYEEGEDEYEKEEGEEDDEEDHDSGKHGLVIAIMKKKPSY